MFGFFHLAFDFGFLTAALRAHVFKMPGDGIGGTRFLSERGEAHTTVKAVAVYVFDGLLTV
jgi:hypothetical protein